MPEKNERKIDWERAETKLTLHLDTIPFTRSQRAEIDYRLTQLKNLFERANAN